DAATGRPQFAQQQLEQGGLAGAVGTQQTDTVAALDDHGKITDQRFTARASKADVLGDDHLLAGLVCTFQQESRLALPLAAYAALNTQGLELAHAALVTSPAGLDALTNPDFFLGQLLVEQRIGGFLGSELLLLVHEEAGVI